MAVLKPYQRKSGEDYFTFTGIVNREYKKFNLKEFTPDMFKCFIFVQGLTAMEDGEIRTRNLSTLEKNRKNQSANGRRRMRTKRKSLTQRDKN